MPEYSDSCQCVTTIRIVLLKGVANFVLALVVLPALSGGDAQPFPVEPSTTPYRHG